MKNAILRFLKMGKVWFSFKEEIFNKKEEHMRKKLSGN